jgi:hypothetical protein
MKVHPALLNRLYKLGMPPKIGTATEAIEWMGNRYKVECKVLQSPDTLRFISIAKPIGAPMPKITAMDAYSTLYHATTTSLRKAADLVEARLIEKKSKLYPK